MLLKEPTVSCVLVWTSLDSSCLGLSVLPGARCPFPSLGYRSYQLLYGKFCVHFFFSPGMFVMQMFSLISNTLCSRLLIHFSAPSMIIDTLEGIFHLLLYSAQSFLYFLSLY